MQGHRKKHAVQTAPEEKQAERSSNWELVTKKQYRKKAGIEWIPVPFFPSQVRAEDQGDDPEESHKHCLASYQSTVLSSWYMLPMHRDL